MGVPERIIVFIVGGATFEEAKEISTIYNVPSNSNRVILGGTSLVNSEDFLADVAQLKGAKFG
jgi:vacuolar protein sorting-associated protein 45